MFGAFGIRYTSWCGVGLLGLLIVVLVGCEAVSCSPCVGKALLPMTQDGVGRSMTGPSSVDLDILRHCSHARFSVAYSSVVDLSWRVELQRVIVCLLRRKVDHGLSRGILAIKACGSGSLDPCRSDVE